MNWSSSRKHYQRITCTLFSLSREHAVVWISPFLCSHITAGYQGRSGYELLLIRYYALVYDVRPSLKLFGRCTPSTKHFLAQSCGKFYKTTLSAHRLFPCRSSASLKLDFARFAHSTFIVLMLGLCSCVRSPSTFAMLLQLAGLNKGF